MEYFNENDIVFNEADIELEEPTAQADFSEGDIVFSEDDIQIEEPKLSIDERAERDQEFRDNHRADVKALAKEQGIGQEEESVTAKDLGAATMSGAADLYDSLGYAAEALGNYTGSETLKTGGKDIQKRGTEAKAYWDRAKSGAARMAELKKFVVPREDGNMNYEKTFLNIVKNPGKIALSVAESLAATGAGMTTGGFLGKAFSLIPRVGEGVAYAMGYGLGEGAISAVGGAKEVEEKIDKMTFDKLAMHPEFRAALMETDGDKKAAKDLVKKAAAGDAAAFNLLTTTILSSPMGYAFSPIFAGKGNITNNFLDSLAIGITGEATQEALQSGAEKAGQNLAVQQRADQGQEVGEGVKEATVAGALTGGAMGGGITTAAEAYTRYDEHKQAKVRKERMFNYAMGFNWSDLSPQQQQLKASLDEFQGTSLTPEQQQQKEQLKTMFFSTMSPEQQKIVEEEGLRVEDIQTRFKDLIKENEDAEIPEAILDDVDMQERILNQLGETEQPEEAAQEEEIAPEVKAQQEIAGRINRIETMKTHPRLPELVESIQAARDYEKNRPKRMSPTDLKLQMEKEGLDKSQDEYKERMQKLMKQTREDGPYDVFSNYTAAELNALKEGKVSSAMLEKLEESMAELENNPMFNQEQDTYKEEPLSTIKKIRQGRDAEKAFGDLEAVPTKSIKPAPQRETTLEEDGFDMTPIVEEQGIDAKREEIYKKAEAEAAVESFTKDDEYELSKLQEREDEGEELGFEDQARLEELMGKKNTADIENEIEIIEPTTNTKQAAKETNEVDTGDKVIGKNSDGQTLYEDENGARYYLDGRFGIHEPVGVSPYGAEIPTNQERFSKGRSQYLTKEEAEELSGATKDATISQEDTKGVKNDDSTKQRGNTSSTGTNATSGELGVFNQEQTTREQERVPGSTQAVPKNDKRPTGDTIPESAKAELPTENIGVGGLPTIEDDEYNEQGETRSDTVLPKRDYGQPFSLIGLPPVELTKGQRKKFNEKAIEILGKPIEDVTDADREILRHYTGEGGLDEVNENSINQHYTNYETVEAIYTALNNAGIPLNKVLEPAVGSGNFVGFHPGGQWDIVDIDERNVEVTRRLYPNIVNWSVESYETFKGKNYDAIISNVPFASEQMLMREHAMTILPAFKAIHNFYFAHSIGKVKDNGVIAFMTSTGTMDGTTKARSLRSYLMDRGDIIGAFRLPEKSQAKNAHTDTMIDIIFIQKRPDGVESRQPEVNAQFVNIGNKDGYPMNEYFIARPENILGEQIIAIDKTKMGKVGWIATGTPDYSKIELDYRPYTPAKKSKEQKSNFIDLDDAREWAANNNVVFKTTTGTDTHIDIKADSVIVYDTPITFSNTDQTAMFGAPNKSPNAKKVIDLERIKTLTEDAIRLEDKNMLETAKNEIKAYASTYEKAPHKDMSLRKAINNWNSGTKLKEYMSYFDEDFTPAPIYGEKVRFKDSGKLEINANSPLTDRAIYYSNTDNEIDTSKPYQMLSARDIKQLIDDGAYVQSGENTIQLDFIYYSGNIYKKLDALEDMFVNGKVTKAQYATQKAGLSKILPETIPYKKIKFRGTESWLPDKVKAALLNVDRDGKKTIKRGILANGVQEEIYNRYLDHKALAPKGKDETDAENIERTKLYEEILHKEVLPQLKNYVEEKGLADILTEEYNRNSNFYSRPEMTGRLLRDLPKSFRGKPFSMQAHQREGAEKIVFNKKGVLAFAPGGGKTVTAIVAVKQLLEQGVMKKPLFVVPVNTIAQWEESVRELYPDAKVYEFPKIKSGINKGKAKEWKDLTKEDKEQMVYDLANNRYDFTIIGDTMMQKIGLSEEVMDRYINDLVDEISAQEASQEGEEKDKKQKKGEVSVEQKKKALKQGIKMAYAQSEEFDFAKLGFDGIIADEVQYYKNIGMQGRDTEGGLGANIAITYKDKDGNTLKAKDIEAGAQPHSATLGSFRSYDFRFKTKFVSENNNGNNVILLTGTPTPNKPLELMTLLQHLDTKILEEYGIKSSSDFVETFFEIGEDETISSSGTVVKQKSLVSMKNQQFLRNILERYVDYRGFKDMKDLPRPKQIDVKHYLKLSKSGEIIMQDVQHRILQAIEDGKAVKSGQLAPDEVEIALVGMGAGRSASIDLRLYSVGSKEKSQYTKEEAARIIAEDIQTEENNKILKTISLVTAQYKKNSNSGQIIFLDRLTVENEDGSKTSTHQEIREKILATGLFDPKEVIFANGQEHVNPLTGEPVKSAPSADRLNLIMDMYNEGKIKVVIGNTAKLGVGVDLNRKTTDIYQLDIPYRPDEIEQRSNRGVRQGNENSEVRVHQFFQLGTFDERSYKIVMDKRGFNDVYGFSDNEAVELDDTGSVKVDTGEAIDPYQAVIDLESDPFERERLRKQRTLDNSKKNTLNINKAIITLENTLRTKEGSIKNYTDAITRIDEELKPANYPKYESVKDEIEKAEKLEQHIAKLNERKEKYIKTIFTIKADIKTIKEKIEGRQQDKANIASESAFIKDEFTRDGEYVDYDKIKDAFTENAILEKEGKEEILEDEGDVFDFGEIPEAGTELTKFQRAHIDALRKRAGNPRILVGNKVMVSKQGSIVGGRYRPSDHTIFISKGYGGSYRVLYHELVHALYIRITKENQQFAKELFAIKSDVQNALEDEGVNVKEVYGLKNIDEFLAEFFSSVEFRAKLDSMPYAKNDVAPKEKTMLDKVLEFLRKILGKTEKQSTVSDAVNKLLNEYKQEAEALAQKTRKPSTTSKTLDMAIEDGAREHFKRIGEELGLHTFDVFTTSNNTLHLNLLIVGQKKNGSGTTAMEELISYADEKGMRITLSPGLKDDNFGTTSRTRLVSFYKRFGFVENKGKNKDFSISGGMYREPKATMRPGFIDFGAIAQVPYATTGMINNAKNKLDKIISDSLTGKIKDTKLDNFIRRRLGGSLAGLGMLTREQEKVFVAKYRELQRKLAQADISAEEKAKLIEDSQGSIATDLFNMVSIQYLENPEARETIAEEYPELVDALEEIREYINGLSREAMERGLILPSQFNKWEDRYLSRLYLLTQKPTVAAKVTSGIKLYEQKAGRKIDSIIDYIMENPGEAERLGAVLDIDKAIKLTIAKTQGNIGLEDFLRGIAADTDIVNSAHTVELNQDVANLPKKFSPEYAKQVVIPYIEDVIQNLDKSTHLSADMTYIQRTEAEIEGLLGTIEYVKEGIALAEASMELSEDDTKAQLPKDKRYGPLSGQFVTKDVASLVISQFAVVNNPEMLVDKIDHAGKKLLVYFKWAKVPANIFSYPRNFMSNFFQWSMSGADPAQFATSYAKAIFSMLKKDVWHQNARKGGIFGTNAIGAEVNDALKIMAEELGAGRTKTKRLYNAMQAVGNAYGVIDDIAKIARIRYGMEVDGLSLEDAVDVAQQSHYDYSLTYDLVRGMRDPDFKRGMALKLIGTLFPTYTHKTIAYLYDTMIHRPATLALIGAALVMLTGGDDDDRDKIGHKRYDKIMATTPDWVKKNPLIRTDMKKTKDGHVEVTYTDISYVVPFGSLLSALYQTGQGDPVGGLSGIGLAGTPLHMIGGLLTNKDAFTGKEIYYEHDQYEKYKDISMYVATQWAPGTITKLYSLSETRHPVLPRLIGINSYVYQDNELRDWQMHGAKKAKLDAGKRVLLYKRKNGQARKKMMEGEISRSEYVDIRNKNLAEIKKWKKLGIDAYKEKTKK